MRKPLFDIVDRKSGTAAAILQRRPLDLRVTSVFPSPRAERERDATAPLDMG
jgi:hypothetical protein